MSRAPGMVSAKKPERTKAAFPPGKTQRREKAFTERENQSNFSCRKNCFSCGNKKEKYDGQY